MRRVQAMRLEHLERQKALAEAEAEAEMLGNFIRLADWMVCENLLLVVVGACDEYYKQIQRFSTDEKMLSKNGARVASVCYAALALMSLPQPETPAQLLQLCVVRGSLQACS